MSRCTCPNRLREKTDGAVRTTAQGFKRERRKIQCSCFKARMYSYIYSVHYMVDIFRPSAYNLNATSQSVLVLTALTSSSADRYNCRVRRIKDMWERHFRRWLQPVLLVISCIWRGLDHVKRVCVAGVRAQVLLGLVQHATMDEHHIACNIAKAQSMT